MARKERNNVDYFPHSVNHGKKMFYLRDKFKNDGYAVWFMLLEELGKAEYHYLDLKDDIQLMYLSSQFKVSELMLNEIIEILVKFEEFDKQLWCDEKILFNEKFNKNISDAYKKRNNDVVSKNQLVTLLTGKGRGLLDKSTLKPTKQPTKGVINPQSKVKKSKEEYSKVDNTIEKKESSKNREILNNDICKRILNDAIWFEVAVLKAFKLDQDKYIYYFFEFWSGNYHGHVLEDMPKVDNEIKKHFINWLKIQLKKEKEGLSGSQIEKDIKTVESAHDIIDRMKD